MELDKGMKTIWNKLPRKVKTEINSYRKTKIHRCIECRIPFFQIDEYEWKHGCKHNKNLRLTVG